MSRIITLILAIACSSFASAYTSEQLTEYYRCVYAAEQGILKKDYSVAAKLYEDAAKTGVTMFAMDANNAAVCAAHIKDHKKLTAYAMLLISKGAQLAFFKKAGFDGYRKSAEWKTLNEAYPILVAEREKRIDKTLVQKVNDLINKQQSELYAQTPDIRNSKKKLVTSDDPTMELKELMKKHDYLGEEVIGADFRGSNLSDWPIWGILILNHFNGASLDTSRESKLRMAELLTAAIKEGKLRSEVGVSWIEQAKRIHLYGTFQIINDTLRQTKCDPKMSQYKSHRHSLFCDTCKVANEFIDAYYLDAPVNIRQKVLYNYRNRTRGRKNQADFIFTGPMQDLGRLERGSGMEMMYQITDVAAY